MFYYNFSEATNLPLKEAPDVGGFLHLFFRYISVSGYIYNGFIAWNLDTTYLLLHSAQQTKATKGHTRRPKTNHKIKAVGLWFLLRNNES